MRRTEKNSLGKTERIIKKDLITQLIIKEITVSLLKDKKYENIVLKNPIRVDKETKNRVNEDKSH